MGPLSFKRHRFPPDVIRHAVGLYFRFTLPRGLSWVRGLIAAVPAPVASALHVALAGCAHQQRGAWLLHRPL